MKRVLVLAYDGLEYMLVRLWRLTPLMQTRYGTYKAAVDPVQRKPYTPSAWTTIITGLPPEKHPVHDFWRYPGWLEKLRHLPPIKWIPNKRRILWRLGLRPKPILAMTKDRPRTWFDVIKPSVALFVPGLTEEAHIRQRYVYAEERGVNALIEATWDVHRYRVKTFMNKLAESEWRLFMAWFDIADILGHICWHRCRDQLRRAYRELAELAEWTKNKVDGDTLVLILSDHGMGPSGDGITGDHTSYGLWSINKPLDWFQPKEATDFYGLVLRYILKQEAHTK